MAQVPSQTMKTTSDNNTTSRPSSSLLEGVDAPKKLTATELDRLYENANTCDDAIFAEMRSNILLVSGDHYTKKGSEFQDRIKKSKGLSEATKLRLVKNHVATICKKYRARVLSHAPNTTIVPNNQDEMQDQKAAELNNSVWTYYKKVHKLRKKIRGWAKDFIESGECYCKIFWDATKGEHVGFEQLVTEEGAHFEQDEMGNLTPIPDEKKPVMSGDFVFERIYPFNVLRDPHSQSMEDSPYIIIRKMVDKSYALALAGGDVEKIRRIEDMEESTYLVFDGDKATYQKEGKKIMLREHYYRPCPKYPKGYYYIAVKTEIIVEGELPFGIWPIAGGGCIEINTSARFRSPIKQMRPYQVEINRSASKIAETQITLGDDKLVMMNGAKLSMGESYSGLRAFTVTGGGEPTVLAGRSGDQYLGYMQSQISELYTVMETPEDDSPDAKLDPYAMLYTSMKSKQNFSEYGEAFEEFLVDITEIFCELAKNYLEPYHVIPIIGRSEAVNIAEFKNTNKNSTVIKVEASSLDLDTMMAKQLAINHTMQYVGNTLKKDEIGQFLRAMPFMNGEEMFGDFAINYDMSKNDMLAMDRGEVPSINIYDDHKYLIQRAVNRTKKADFKLLPPQIQAIYKQYITAHQNAEVKVQTEVQRAQQGYIPVDGPLITVDYYRQDPVTGETKRAKVPQRALEWLEKHLEAQGSSLASLEDMNKGALAQMAAMMEQAPTLQGLPHQGMPQPM